MAILLQDLRLALRNLLRVPQFTWPALLVLALGLGATAAMVGTLRTVFFSAPPFPEPERTHALWWSDERKWTRPASWPLYLEVKDRLKGVATVEGISSADMNLGGDGDPEVVVVGRITPGFFQVFPVQPLLGTPTWEPTTTRGVILTEGIWRNRYAADPGILGRTVQLNGESHPVLAVVPATLRLRGVQVFIPLVPSPSNLQGRYNRFMPIYARTAPGVTEARFKTELEVLSKAMAAEHPGEQEATTHLASSIYLLQRREAHKTLGAILSLATALLVAITLVNLANAMLARVLVGAEDTALRVALGASRWMAVRPRLMEALVICTGGTLLALGVAQVALVLLRPTVGKDLQAIRPLTLDAGLLGWTSLAAFLVALGLGGIPGLLLGRFRLGALLNSGGRGLVKGGSKGLRVALVVVQVSLALTLLASFASLGSLLLKLQGTPLGLRTQGVAVFTCDTSAKTPEAGKQADLKAMALLARLRAIPGVTQAGSIAMLPVEAYGWNFKSEIHDRPMREDEWVEMRTASPGLFDAFGIKLRAGRDYTDADMTSNAPVAIVSESLARNFWPGKDPLGQEFKSDDRWFQVIGVVSDVRNAGPANDSHQMVAYFPSPTGMASTTFVVQYGNPRLMDLTALRRAAREVAPDWPAKGMRPMEDVVGENLAGLSTQVQLLGFAGALALVLALAGLHNLLVYLVAQRTREFGVRAALGATPGQILQQVLRSGVWTGLLGTGLGVAAALIAGRLLAAVLADAQPANTASLLWSAAALLLGSTLASLIPAIRAARIQPAEALRQN
jgi:putative ABC transport system permease protein